VIDGKDLLAGSFNVVVVVVVSMVCVLRRDVNLSTETMGIKSNKNQSLMLTQ